jgi:hypothetical protein
MRRFAAGLCLANFMLMAVACGPADAPDADQTGGAPVAAPRIDPEAPPGLVETSFLSGGQRLYGSVYLANGAGPHPAVVLLHGFPGHELNLDLAQALRAEGFNVLFFHYRGAWGSEGTYSLNHVIEDVAAATDYLRGDAVMLRTDPSRILLVGHSMGGFAALKGAANDPDVRCVAGLAPADMSAIADSMIADPAASDEFAAYADQLGMLAGLDGKAMVADIIAQRDSLDPVALAPRLAGKSILIVMGDKDTMIPRPLAMTAAFKATPGVQVSGVELSGDHSFSWSRRELADTVIDWGKACAGLP